MSAKRKAFADLTFQQQVSRAMVPARALLFEGFDGLMVGQTETNEVTETITELLGRDVTDILPDDLKGLNELEHALMAALALGAAVGLMLRPDAFASGAR